MATKGPLTAAASPAAKNTTFPWLVLVAGWLVPGLGHILTGRWIRAILLFASITLMFSLGIAMQGKIYLPNTSEILDMLGFVGSLGSGVLYFIGRLMDWGQNPVQVVTADYGTKFIVVAGLLNFVAAVDAHNLSTGRKS